MFFSFEDCLYLDAFGMLFFKIFLSGYDSTSEGAKNLEKWWVCIPRHSGRTRRLLLRRASLESRSTVDQHEYETDHGFVGPRALAS